MHNTQVCIVFAVFGLMFIIMAVLMFTFVFKIAQYASKNAQEAAAKRKEALQALAQEMGFTYRAEPHEDLSLPFKPFEDFGNDYPKHFTNILEGTFDDVNWLVFDYQYKTPGTGRHSGTTHRSTVFCAFAGGFSFPNFAMGPECFLVGWIEAFGVMKDIDFEGYPNFSDKFCLVGKDEQAIRSFFKPEILGFFESYFDKPEDIPKIEANDDRMIFTGMGNAVLDYVRPEKIQDCLRKASPVVKKFREVHSEIF